MRGLWSVTPFVECPNCRKLLDIQITQCPECRELISKEYAVLSAASNVVNTRACNLAKEIGLTDRILAPLFVGASIFLYVIDSRILQSSVFSWLTIVAPAAQLLMVMAWHVLFGKFPLGDLAFVNAKRQVMWSGRLWGLILALQMALVLAIRH